jgi:phosphate transport system substrate-binding protein
MRLDRLYLRALLAGACTLLMGLAQSASAAACGTEVDPALPSYRPHAIELPRAAGWIAADGAIMVVGYNDMRDMLQTMGAAFTAAHPDVRLRFDLPGTRFAPAALARGTSAFAPMGALFTPPQLAEYRSIAGGDPLPIRIAHASLDAHALSGPLAVFVHRDNPLRSITMAQIAQVFAGEVKDWRALGVDGEWSGREVHLYGMQPGTALAHELQVMTMHGQAFTARMAGVPQSAELVEKVAADPVAIGFAAAVRATSSVRMLEIAANEQSRPVALTCENIVAGRYPLDRHLLIYLARPVTSVAREFVRFALSREGQQAVAASPQRYLPLSARDAAVELAKIE